MTAALAPYHRPSTRFALGNWIGGDEFRLRLEHLYEHIVINGGTGRGKSMLMQCLCRPAIDNGEGITVVDPQGDTAEDLALHVAAKPPGPERDRLVQRVIPWKPSPQGSIRIDLFGDLARFSGAAYYDALWARVGQVVEAIIQSHGEQNTDAMPRLERWLSLAIFGCGVFYAPGKYLGLPSLSALLDPAHPKHPAKWGLIAPVLPEEVLADFNKLKSEKRAKDQEAWVESTMNRIRRLFRSETFRQSLEPDGPGIDFERVILDRMVLLCNFRPGESLSLEQSQVLSAFVILGLSNASARIAARTPLPKRTPHLLCVDEAERLLTETLRMNYAIKRKERLIHCLAFQDLSAARRGDIDFVPRFISQAGVHFSFQQKWNEDNDLLGRFYAVPHLRFDRLLEWRDRVITHRKVLTTNVTFGANTTVTGSGGLAFNQSMGKTKQLSAALNAQEQTTQALAQSHSDGGARHWSRSDSENETDTHAVGNGLALSEHEGTAYGQNRTETESGSETNGSSCRQLIHWPERASHSFNNTKGWATALAETFNRSRGTGLTKSENEQFSSSRGRGVTLGNGGATNWNDTVGTTDTNGQSLGRSWGLSEAEAETLGQAVNLGWARALGRTAAFGLSESFLPVIKTERVDTGRLLWAIEDQIMRFVKLLRIMPKQHCFVYVNDGPSGVLRVADVKDALGPGYADAYRRALVDFLRISAARRHAFYFVPRDPVAVRLADEPPPVIEEPAENSNFED